MLLVDVKVVPGSNTMHWELHNTIIVCHHKNPDDTKTVNADIINAFAQALGINHSKIHVVHGVADRHKKFKIGEATATFDKLVQQLNLSK